MRDPYFRLATSIIGVTVTDAWKLSIFYSLFSKLQLKHNIELSITVKVYAGILTKQLLRKAKIILPKIDDGISVDVESINPYYKDEVSDISEASIAELKIKFYSITKNQKGKNYRKSRRCVEYNKLTVAYCGCCNKAYCYSVGTVNHGRTCLVDHIRFMKQQNARRKTRSGVN